MATATRDKNEKVETKKPDEQVPPAESVFEGVKKLDPSKLVLIEGKLFTTEAMELYEVDVPLPEVSKKNKPEFRWTGGKISSELWGQIKAFMAWSYDTFKSEAQLKLYYNSDTRLWSAVVLNQTVGSLHTRETEKEEENATVVELLASGATRMGSVHHHSDISAFQSGGDHRDEIDRPGLHITLGNMTAAEYSIHLRVMWRDKLFDVSPSEWFEVPESIRKLAAEAWSAGCREELVKICKTFLVSKVTNFSAVPEAWKKTIIKRDYGSGAWHGGQGEFAHPFRGVYGEWAGGDLDGVPEPEYSGPRNQHIGFSGSSNAIPASGTQVRESSTDTQLASLTGLSKSDKDGFEAELRALGIFLPFSQEQMMITLQRCVLSPFWLSAVTSFGAKHKTFAQALGHVPELAKLIRSAIKGTKATEAQALALLRKYALRQPPQGAKVS